MTERFISDDFWHDPFVEGMDSEGKLLYLYMFTNKHQTPSGVFQATIRTMAFDTGIDQAKVKDLLKHFENTKKIRYYPETSQVWVVNFVIHQAKNASFLQASLSCASKQLKDQRFTEYYKFYEEKGIWKPNRGGTVVTGCDHSDTTVAPPSPHGSLSVLSCNNPVLSCPVKGDTQGGIGAGENGGSFDTIKKILKEKKK